jgi:hypothetical protein
MNSLEKAFEEVKNEFNNFSVGVTKYDSADDDNKPIILEDVTDIYENLYNIYDDLKSNININYDRDRYDIEAFLNILQEKYDILNVPYGNSSKTFLTPGENTTAGKEAKEKFKKFLKIKRYSFFYTFFYSNKK